MGAGKRVRFAVLPAILALGDQVLLSGIHSRKPHAVPLPDGTQLSTSTSLNAKHFEDIDIVIVAVRTNAIWGVLNALNDIPRKKDISIVMDTPPLRLSDFVKMRTFSGFKSVIVGEDWFKLSPILLIKDLITRGAIGGALHQIKLDRMSYRYHGLVTLRSIAGTRWFRSIKATMAEDGKTSYSVVTGNGISCRAILPRDYTRGTLYVAGNRGWISNHVPDGDAGDGHLIGFPLEESGWYQPISLDGNMLPSDAVDQNVTSLPLEYLEDNTAINRLKIRGYARLVEDLMTDNVEYDIIDGLYDYFATAAVERLKRFCDLPVRNSQQSVLRIVLSLHQYERQTPECYL
ncbi:hypothetical protein [Ruegeria atlantica]|uniref:hypothetical protein n=1 Tax=Ruegeria atlantica TaxID=81569 RepID=UPI0024952A25|nr:hypothetical protein [Ruegeria atlantica]